MTVFKGLFSIRVFWVFTFLLFAPITHAKNRVVHLVVAYQTVHFAGQAGQAIAVNQQIPAPTLHFTQGDTVTVVVENQLNQETAIHWHGILLPWQMDGVMGVTQRGIPPHHEFTYHFTLRQSGTYWYHAHADLQEQQGLYGAFIIDPLTKPKQVTNRDEVIVLSDWSNTDPDQILANLKKEGDYYAPRFPLQPSLVKFITDYRQGDAMEKKQLLSDYAMMQHMRMSIYDLSDVAYDAFLMNGHTSQSPWTALVKVGDVVRLRFIGAMGSTIYHIKIPNASMQLINVDGNDVDPVTLHELTISPGETDDVLVRVREAAPTYIYAESADTLGSVFGALITSSTQALHADTITPFPEPLPVTRSMAMPGMAMPGMPMMGNQYSSLKAAVPTNDPDKPIAKTLHLALDGYMDKYIWFINGVPLHLAKPIILQPNQRYRFVMTNLSMMHHPMHLHGHWFIVREGRGRFDPLLHTIDIAPGETITADVDTDASGQWLFHCHLLYHMMSGMSRVFQYSSLLSIVNDHAAPAHDIQSTGFVNRPIIRVDEVRPIDAALVRHPMPHENPIWAATFLDVGADPFNNTQTVTFKSLIGKDENKLELFTNDAEIEQGRVESADMDVFYWHLLNNFWAMKGGLNYRYRPSAAPYWAPGVGLEGVMPYFIDTNLRLYHYAGVEKLDIDLERDTQITNNFFIRLGVESLFGTATNADAAIGAGLNQMRYVLRPYYRVRPGWTVYVQYEHQKNTGDYQIFEQAQGISAVQNLLTVGLTMIW